MPDLVVAIHHVSVVVRDTARALEFYRAILGFATDDRRPALDFPGAWLRAGSVELHLLQVSNPDPADGRPAHVGRDRHLALRVKDLEAVRRALEGAGVAYTRSRSGRQAIFFRDPDGNGLELIQD